MNMYCPHSYFPDLLSPSPSSSKLKKRAATSSAEFEAFRKCSSNLIRGIQDPELLAWELYSDDVISQTVMDKVSMVGLSSVQRKTRLLNAVRLQIATDPTKFQNLLKVLRNQPQLKDVAEKLKTAYDSQLEEDGRETELKGLSYCKL